MNILLTAFLFGAIAGTFPGPMLTAGFMTIIKNPKGFYKTLLFPVIAGSIEISIGIIMVKLGAAFFTPEVLLIITILGVINIFWIAYTVFIDRENFSLVPENFQKKSPNEAPLHDNSHYMSISYLKAGLLTLLNGELYLFWIAICIPLALESEQSMPNGGVYFVFAMVLGVSIMTWFLYFIMHISRKSLQNKKLMKTIPIITSLFFVGIGIKMMDTIFTLI